MAASGMSLTTPVLRGDSVGLCVRRFTCGGPRRPPRITAGRRRNVHYPLCRFRRAKKLRSSGQGVRWNATRAGAAARPGPRAILRIGLRATLDRPAVRARLGALLVAAVTIFGLAYLVAVRTRRGQ